MKVLSFLPRCTLQRRVEKALRSAQFLMDDLASAKQCLQAAQFARYEGVVIGSDALFVADVLALVKLLRHENSDTTIFVFSRYLALGQRLCLFEAGADDCVGEPFFASEVAVRLAYRYGCIRPASDLEACGATTVLCSGDLKLDLVRRRTTRLEKTIDLRPKEVVLLEYLVRKRKLPGHPNDDP